MKAILLTVVICMLIGTAQAQDQSNIDTKAFLEDRIKKTQELDKFRYNLEKARLVADTEKLQTTTMIEKAKQGNPASSPEDVAAPTNLNHSVAAIPVSGFPKVLYVQGGTVTFSHNGRQVKVKNRDYIDGYKIVRIDAAGVTLQRDGEEAIVLAYN